MTNKSTRGGCEYIFPRDLLQLMLIKALRFPVPQQSFTHHILAVPTDTGAISLCVSPSHLPKDIAQAQKEASSASSTAKLVNVKRFTGEQLSNSIWPDGPSWPNHCGQLSSSRPLAQSPVLLPAPCRAAQLGGPGEQTRVPRTGSCCEPKSEKSHGSPARIHYLHTDLQDRVRRERDG